MNGRFFARALAFVLLLVVVGGLGVLAYNAGVSAGVSQAVVTQGGQPVTVVPVAPYPYWHGGFGFFGFIFWIIGFFLIIGLLRAVFGWGRWGRGGWGGRGYYGPGPGGPGGRGGPGGPYGDRMDRVADWHRELHRRDEAGTNPPAGGAPSTGASTGA